MWRLWRTKTSRFICIMTTDARASDWPSLLGMHRPPCWLLPRQRLPCRMLFKISSLSRISPSLKSLLFYFNKLPVNHSPPRFYLPFFPPHPKNVGSPLFQKGERRPECVVRL